MKKFLIILVVLIIGTVGQINAGVIKNGTSPNNTESTVRRSGNTFEVIKTSSQDIQTYLNWKDRDGIVYPIYISKKGACYVKRISKKTNKEYKYYLPKEVQEQVRKELGL